ncbi:MAG: hypothetical protein GY909_15525 [Oligoflexia bacterium]|nr:hypothetical protein [Oligoflexia bacterium]
MGALAKFDPNKVKDRSKIVLLNKNIDRAKSLITKHKKISKNIELKHKELEILNQECLVVEFEIAKLGLSCIDLFHGGNAGNRFTTTDFADSIGYNRKQVSTWISIYRDIVLKLDPKDIKSIKKDKKLWNRCAKTYNNVTEIQRLENSKNNTPKKKRGSIKGASKEVVRTLYQNADTLNIDKLRKAIRSLKHVLHVLNNLELTERDQAQFLEIEQLYRKGLIVIQAKKDASK